MIIKPVKLMLTHIYALIVCVVFLKKEHVKTGGCCKLNNGAKQSFSQPVV